MNHKYRGNVRPFVELSGERQGDDWLLRVKDNGIGIERKYHEKIFEAFQRLHSDEEYEGTGIGLATCKKIVERLGGRIWVESDVSQGTDFLFSLPITLTKFSGACTCNQSIILSAALILSWTPLFDLMFL